MTTLTATEIKGSFEAIEITTENLAGVIGGVTPNDMRNEIISALTGTEEDVIYYASWQYEGEAESRHYVLFPQAGRGGVCAGGFTEWTDANTLDEIEQQYEAGTLSN
jgi:hypothetical protein